MTDKVRAFLKKKLEQLGKNGINRDMYTLIRLVEIYGDVTKTLNEADTEAEKILA